MARPTWKGHLSFGLVNVPVALFPAEERSELSFHMVDSRNRARVRYERVNAETGEEVPWEDIVKAYEYEEGEYVLLDDEDFKRAALESSQTIEIEDFVDRESIPIVYFDKPYYLVPGKKAEKAYAILREAIRRSGKVGIAKVVIRTRQHLSAVGVEGDMIVLELLRFHEEIRDPKDYDVPHEKLEALKITKKEIDLAQKLVDAMSADWEPEKYHDEYRDKLVAWIEKKAKSGGKVPPPIAEKEEAPGAKVIDMMELLNKSVKESAKKKKAKSPPPKQPQRARRAP
ncbi:Ku protein [bacterium]|nr:Ku protein [bacterium]